VIGLTTGRQTNQRLNSLLKELAHTIPEAQIVRRGKSGLDELGRRLMNDGSDYAVMLQRWHGGPGGIDFYKVQADGLSLLPPSLVLKGVKLKREHTNPRRGIAQAVTCDQKISEASQRLMRTLCTVLALPESKPPLSPKIKTTLHIGDVTGGTIRIAVTSPPGQIEIGPSILVSRLVWDVHAQS